MGDTQQPNDDLEQLEVPHPMSCTIGELREIREVFHIDLVPRFLEAGITSVDVIEPLVYVAQRRLGLPRARARKAAQELSPMDVVLEEPPVREEDVGDSTTTKTTKGADPPNPASSAT